MKMATYVARRAAEIVPTIVGVMTITFLLLATLPVENQLESAFGTSNPRNPCHYDPTCPCKDVYHNNSLTGSCTNPLYVTLTHRLGLDRPVPERWAIYMYHSFTFQWGTVDNNSQVEQTYPFAKHSTVVHFLGEMLPYTIELAALSLALILAIAIPIGNLSAVNRNRPIDQASRVVSFSGFAIPPFLLGSLVVFGVYYLLLPHTGINVATPWCIHRENLEFELLGSWPQPGCYPPPVNGATFYPVWLSAGALSTPTGFPTIDAAVHHQYWLSVDTLIRLILPALVIAYGSVAALLRFVRNSMLEVMNLDYIRTARAKGVPERVVVSRHAGRNSLNVTITVLGLTFAGFLGGFPVIEAVFRLNGIGRALAFSILQPFDFGVIFGSTLLFTYLVVGANITVDVLYAYLDPRVRLG